MVKQLDLFGSQSLNVNRDFKECLVRVVAESGLSRDEFLDQLNGVAARYGIRLMKGNGSDLTKATFEKWLNVNSMAYMPPISAITAICKVSKSLELLQVFTSALGVEVIDEKRSKRLQWADAFIEEREARKRKNKLEAEL